MIGFEVDLDGVAMRVYSWGASARGNLADGSEEMLRHETGAGSRTKRGSNFDPASLDHTSERSGFLWIMQRP